MSFNDIIGHDSIIKEMKNAIETEKFAHAHILVGEDGIGKSLISRNIALKILKKERDTEYADLIEWRIEKNKKSLGVSDIRNLVEEINKKPYEGQNKVIIMYEAHKMTIQAQNAFLKTIEEPPKGVFIILLCENLQVILDTIKSRCQIHKLKALNNYEINEFLRKKYSHLIDGEIKVLTAFSNGIPGRIEKFLEDDKFNNIRKITLEVLIKSSHLNKEEVLKFEKLLIKYKFDWKEILNTLLLYIRDAIVYKETGSENIIINIDKIGDIKELSNIYSFKKLNNLIDIINESRERLDRNLNPSLVFDMMLLKIQEV